jgi:hypothetical protein
MRSPSLAPIFDDAVHMVLCDFGKQGLAYVETEPPTTEQTVVNDLLAGTYRKPVQVVAFNVTEGWSRDVSEDMAHEVLERARAGRLTIPRGTQAFLETLLDEEVEPELCASR